MLGALGLVIGAHCGSKRHGLRYWTGCFLFGRTAWALMGPPGGVRVCMPLHMHVQVILRAPRFFPEDVLEEIKT